MCGSYQAFRAYLGLHRTGAGSHPNELIGIGRTPWEQLGGWMVMIGGGLALLWLVARARSVGLAHARVTASADDGNPRG